MVLGMSSYLHLLPFLLILAAVVFVSAIWRSHIDRLENTIKEDSNDPSFSVNFSPSTHQRKCHAKCISNAMKNAAETGS